MPELSVLMTSGLFLGGCCILTGFLTTVSQQWAAHTNTTGVSEYNWKGKYHTFDHSFFMQTCLFLGQLSCLGIHRIILKRRGPAPENQENGGNVARDRQRPPGGHGGDRGATEPGAVGGEGIGGPGAHEDQVQREVIYRRRQDGVGHNDRNHADNGRPDGDEEGDIRRRRHQELRLAGQRRRDIRVNRNRPRDKKEYNKIIFLPCALCDFAKTGLIFIGIRQTYPSSFIMLQGVGLLSTCLLTVAFVGREKTVKKLQWVGASVCAVGLASCGLVDYVWGKDYTYDPYGIAAGDLLIVMAQLMTAIQVILEQRFVKKHDIDPLVAVGLEGMFGSVLLLILLIPFYFVDVGAFNTLPKHRLEDPYDAVLQMRSQPLLIVAFLGSVLFLPLFYYCGISITKHLDAVNRMGVEVNINIFAWLIYLIVGWEETHVIQILGFALAFLGVFIFFLNPIIDRYKVWKGDPLTLPVDDEAAPLLNPGNPGVQDYGAERPQVNRPM